MQNGYVGDAGDFGKYRLLKALCSPGGDDSGPTLSLGVVWYLVDGGATGTHTGYLTRTPRNERLYRLCDPTLYDGLQKLVHGNDRNVRAVREGLLLPTGTVFYEETLSFGGTPGSGPSSVQQRLAHRKQWVKDAVESTQECDLIFVDPDIGLEVPSVKRHEPKGLKYAFFDELWPYLKAGKSLVIYQHTGRTNAKEGVKRRLCEIAERLSAIGPFGFLYHRGTSRSFLVAPATSHRDVLLARASRLVQGPWSRHFDLIR